MVSVLAVEGIVSTGVGPQFVDSAVPDVFASPLPQPRAPPGQDFLSGPAAEPQVGGACTVGPVKNGGGGQDILAVGLLPAPEVFLGRRHIAHERRVVAAPAAPSAPEFAHVSHSLNSSPITTLAMFILALKALTICSSIVPSAIRSM